MNNNIYEIIGTNGDKIRRYRNGTIEQICDDELLNENDENYSTIEEVIKDMDFWSDYKHYYKIINPKDADER